MSATAAAPAPAAAGSSKKKMLLLIVGAIALLAAGGGAAFLLMPKPAAPAGAQAEAKKELSKSKPVFVPFESFTVNLADRDLERFAQVTFSVETQDNATGERLKTHLPAIRSQVLLMMSGKTLASLSGREGKQTLANEILVETRRAAGLPDDDKSLIAVHFSHFVMQ